MNQSETIRVDIGFERAPLRVLLVALVDDYGDPSRGDSYEKINFLHPLRAMGHRVTSFDPCREIRAVGKAEANRRLLRLVETGRPDALLFVPFQDEIDPATLARARETSTATIAWFCDDQWRFDGFTKRFAPHLDWCVTTDPAAPAKYAAVGQRNVFVTTWAANHRLYRPSSLSKRWDVTFIGMAHGCRPQMIKRLRDAGVPVEVWGHGWPSGRLSTRKMIEVFGLSKVCLNLSNASQPDAPQQVKGRHFEIPCCGGFQITTPVDGVEKFFAPEEEIVLCGEAALADRIKYWLGRGTVCEEIARAGRERVLREHTWDHRFDALFDRVRRDDPKAAGWGRAVRAPSSASGAAPVESAPAPVPESAPVSVPESASERAAARAADRAAARASVVILTGGGDHLWTCLASLCKHTPQPHEVVIIDNGSTDGTTERQLLEWRDDDNPVVIVRNEENLGCPMGRMQAIGLARGDPVVLLDDDAIPTTGWLATLSSRLESGIVQIIGPSTNLISGAQRIVTNEYRTLDEMEAFAAQVTRENAGRIEPAGRLMGFCLAFRREVLDKIGGFDGSFGKYGFEDDDFCWRARLAGFRLGIARDAFVHHYGNLGGLHGKEFNEALDAAWLKFRTKWRLPELLTFGAYTELAHQYRLVRPFDDARDVCPMPTVEELGGRVVRGDR